MSIQLLTFSSASTLSVGPDPYLTSVTLLLSGDDLVDHSSSPKTITNYGNVAVSTTTKKYGTGSIYFDGATLTCMRVGSGSATELMDTAGNFTMEFWMYPTVFTTNETHLAHINPLVGSYQTGCGVAMYGGNIYCLVNGYSTKFDSGVTYSINTWYHIAVVRDSTTITLYVDGVPVGTSSSSITAGTYNYLVIGNEISGSSWDNTYPFTGYIDDFRITKGVARYTAAFYPPTTALLNGNSVTLRSLSAPDAPTGVVATVDNTTASVAFNVPFNGLSPITGYTVKAYTGATYSGISNTGTSSPVTISGLSNSTAYTFTITATNSVGSTESAKSATPTAPTAPTSVFASPANASILASFTLSTNNGAYITGYTVKAYIGASYTGISTTGTSSPITITGLTNGTSYSVTVTATNAVGSTESASSSPATPNLTSTGTVARLNGNDLLDHSVNNFTVTAYGNTAVSTAYKKYGTGSIYFDQASDYLAFPNAANLALGAGDFTVECWVYVPAGTTHTYQRVFWFEYNSVVNNSGLAPELYSGTSAQYTLNYGGGQIQGNTTIPARDTWVHLAAARASGTMRFFVNGVLQGSGSDTATYTNAVSGPLVGTAYEGGSLRTNTLGGYVDDFRVTRGTALYTTNFTPPTSELTN